METWSFLEGFNYITLIIGIINMLIHLSEP